MKHWLTVSTLLIFSTISAFSQAVFKEGFIIQNDNDTVFGLIEFKGNKSNANGCIFKKDNESEPHLFAPDDLKAYRFDESKYYISKVITVNGKDELLFLEYLINGTVDVYYYYDGIDEHYFIDGGDNQLIELKKSSKEFDTYRRRVILESKQHIGILKYIFRESPAISKQVETIELNRKALIDITHAYHNEVCANEECIIYEKKSPHENIKVGILLGISAVTISEAKNIPVEDIYLRNSDFGLILCPSAGFFVKANLPSINANMFLQYQGTISYLNLNTTNIYYDMGNDLKHKDKISYSQTSFNNTAVLKYEFNESRNVRPNIHVGGFYNFGFGDTYSRDYRIYLTTGTLYREGEGVEYPFISVDYGPIVGFGFVADITKKNAILVDLQYQRGFGLNSYLKANYITLNVGIQF